MFWIVFGMVTNSWGNSGGTSFGIKRERTWLNCRRPPPDRGSTGVAWVERRGEGVKDRMSKSYWHLTRFLRHRTIYLLERSFRTRNRSKEHLALQDITKTSHWVGALRELDFGSRHTKVSGSRHHVSPRTHLLIYKRNMVFIHIKVSHFQWQGLDMLWVSNFFYEIQFLTLVTFDWIDKSLVYIISHNVIFYGSFV